MNALLVALFFCQAQPEQVFSGPQKGEETPGFKVLDLNGPGAGKEVDHIAEWKGAPTLICFVHELTRPASRLMRRLDAHGIQNQEAVKTLFVFLAADPNESERRLPAALKSLDMKSVASVSPDGQEGPGAYGLNKDVTLTILLAKGNKVVANWAINSPNETDFDKILPELDRVTAPALNTAEEMRAEILRLRSEVAALKSEMGELKRAAGPGNMRPAREMKPERGKQ